MHCMNKENSQVKTLEKSRPIFESWNMSALSLPINDKPQDIQSDDQRKFSAPRWLSSHARQLV